MPKGTKSAEMILQILPVSKVEKATSKKMQIYIGNRHLTGKLIESLGTKSNITNTVITGMNPVNILLHSWMQESFLHSISHFECISYNFYTLSIISQHCQLKPGKNT